MDNPVYFIDPDGMEAQAPELDKSDIDVKVDMGYGRMVSSSKISGAVEYSGASKSINAKGQKKIDDFISINSKTGKTTIYHDESSIDRISVDGYAAKYGQWAKQIGTDGQSYEWLKITGKWQGKEGTFEYIKDAAGEINHRWFNGKTP